MGAVGPNPSEPGLGVGPLPCTHFLLEKKGVRLETSQFLRKSGVGYAVCSTQTEDLRCCGSRGFLKLVFGCRNDHLQH